MGSGDKDAGDSGLDGTFIMHFKLSTQKIPQRFSKLVYFLNQNFRFIKWCIPGIHSPEHLSGSQHKSSPSSGSQCGSGLTASPRDLSPPLLQVSQYFRIHLRFFFFFVTVRQRIIWIKCHPRKFFKELACMNLREMASRPDIGCAGRQITIRSNFFEVGISNNNMMVIQYHVEVHHPGSRKLDKFVFFAVSKILKKAWLE